MGESDNDFIDWANSKAPGIAVKKPGAMPQRYAPTDPRAAGTMGGVKIGDKFKFVSEAEMPKLEVDQIILACQSIVQGSECYLALVYLNRARPDDAVSLFTASQSPDIRARWERLWVLSPFFARVARHEDGRKGLLECMKDDLAAIHLLSKFAEQKNDAVERLFQRLHDDLLEILLKHLADFQFDMRRATLLSGIIATIETDGKALRETIEKVAPKTDPEELLSLLYVKGRGGGSRLSAEVLRERLQDWADD